MGRRRLHDRVTETLKAVNIEIRPKEEWPYEPSFCGVVIMSKPHITIDAVLLHCYTNGEFEEHIGRTYRLVKRRLRGKFIVTRYGTLGRVSVRDIPRKQ